MYLLYLELGDDLTKYFVFKIIIYKYINNFSLNFPYIFFIQNTFQF